MSLDQIGVVVGALFTLLVFSYIFGDNFLFRFTIHLFIGVSAGFAGAVAVRNVIIPQLISPILRLVLGAGQPGDGLALIPLVLSLMLLAKLSQRMSQLGSVAMAFLVGIGAAAAVGGAVVGTLFPQSSAAMGLFDLSNLPGSGSEMMVNFVGRIVGVIGTLSTLIYFHFGARPQPNTAPQRFEWIEGISKVGHGFIAITFGALFAGVYSAALTALVERVAFLLAFLP